MSMVIDQAEIDALLAAAHAAPPPEAPPEPPAGPQHRTASRSFAGASPELARLLKVRVPVIARLAATKMPLSELRRISCGSIIKLDKSVETNLELLINNHVIGSGSAVKSGEVFGLRVKIIGDRVQRILTLQK